MHYWKIALMCFCFSLTACTNKKSKILSPVEQRARLDSELRIQEAEIIQIEKERLRDRLSIEVKEKTDSILLAWEKEKQAKTPANTDTSGNIIDTTTQN